MSRLKAITLFRGIHIQIHTHTHMYTHVHMSASELIEEKWFIYPRCSDAASKGLPTPRNVEIPQWTANCAPKSNLNCFQNCIQGRIAHEVSLYFFSLMGIYWLYPLSMRAEPLLWSVCFGYCIFGLFSSFIIFFFWVFTVWISHCISYFFFYPNFTLHFYGYAAFQNIYDGTFFIPRISLSFSLYFYCFDLFWNLFLTYVIDLKNVKFAVNLQ